MDSAFKNKVINDRVSRIVNRGQTRGQRTYSSQSSSSTREVDGLCVQKQEDKSAVSGHNRPSRAAVHVRWMDSASKNKDKPAVSGHNRPSRAAVHVRWMDSTSRNKVINDRVSRIVNRGRTQVTLTHREGNDTRT
ncbi:hypothetical protein J6590_057664 [Homalodisca vitripennis]|nr:hypothetical protein J6590_057664 [Homalodisca vitripennis]